MVNILPRSVRMNLMRRYYLHLVAMLCISLAVVFFAGSALLIPSYFASRTSADSYERYRDALEGSVGLKEREYVTDSISELAEQVRIMNEYGTSAFTADLIDALGERITGAISISNISFTRAENGAAIALSGTARTRSDLLAFADALKESAAFSQVTFPVSQLVVEEDVGFTIQALYTKQ